MNQPKKERFKTSVGGQALMEGIMMRGPKLICCAVRKPDGTIETKLDPVKNHGVWTKIPLVRGAISMIESLIVGYRYMMYSAQVSMGDDYDPEEEETAFEKWVGEHFGQKAEDALLACAAVVGGLLAILLFTVLPTLHRGRREPFYHAGPLGQSGAGSGAESWHLPHLYGGHLQDEGDPPGVRVPRCRAQDHCLL